MSRTSPSRSQHARARRPVTSWLNPARWHSDFVVILERGLALGATLKPALVGDRTSIMRLAAARRAVVFWWPSSRPCRAATTSSRHGYRDVLQKLRAIGLSPVYTLTAALLTNRVGQSPALGSARDYAAPGPDGSRHRCLRRGTRVKLNVIVPARNELQNVPYF